MSASRQELQERVERLERIVKALARVQASYYYADLQAALAELAEAMRP